MSIWRAQAVILAVLFIAYWLAGCADYLPDDPTTEPAPTYSEPSRADEGWLMPELRPEEKATVLAQYPNVKLNGVVPQNLLEKALIFFHANASRISNKKYIGIVDFSKNSRYTRFWIVGIQDNSVVALHVAHGSGSDKNNDGMADIFSNTSESHMSSLGFYLTAESYRGKHGNARRLDGLSSTNSKVRARAIVLHAANYVVERDVQPGRSWGCLTVAMKVRDWVMKTLSSGSLIYADLSSKV